MMDSDRKEWSRFLWRWLGISLALHVIAVIFSQGFYHADEHFQILEFLNWKLGLSPASDLPVEFAEKMRPWLQPGILYAMSKGWIALGVQDPFVWSLSFRALSSVLGFSGLVGLSLCCKYWFENLRWRKIAVIALSLMWYLPAFHARHSSENWSGAALVIGLCLFLLTRVYEKRGSPWIWGGLSGLLFGLSFEFRYQVAVMVAGALFWLWFRAKIGWRDSIALSSGILLACGLGTWVDAWGYGQWVVAPWNYVDFNLIRNMVSVMDTDPWWDLFRRAFTEAWPLLGFLLLLSLPLAWITHPLHVLTWSQFPLFLTHALIGHKELRFLFPLAHAAPVLAVLAAQSLQARVPGFRRLSSKLLYPALAWNLLALCVLTVLPAWMPIRFMDFEWHLKEKSPSEMVLHWKDKNPYEISGLALHFYRPSGVQLRRIQDYREIRGQLEKDKPFWLFYDGFGLSGEAQALADICHPEFQALPSWIPALAEKARLGATLRHVTNWSLYRCAPQATQ